MLDKIFHKVSYLKYLFIIWGFVVAVPELYFRSDNLISNINLGLFLSGVGLSFEGFRNITKYTKKEKKYFSNKRAVYRNVMFVSSVILICIAMGIFFFKLEWFYPNGDPKIIDAFFDLGFGTFSMAIGMISVLKLDLDRYRNFNKNNFDNELFVRRVHD